MRISDWSSDVCSSDLRVAPPKRVGRDLLRLAVAWKIQEQAYGGLGSPTRRRLAELARALERDGDVTRNREIGRASCRERVCQDASISVVAVSLKKKKESENSYNKN